MPRGDRTAPDWNGVLLATRRRVEQRADPTILAPEMTRTPWGEAERLRDRMMVSGPRASAEAAASNQRERLYGAMVAICAERGYEATTVSDLVALSGVSRRDFYRLFRDRQDCLLATMDAILAGAFEVAAREEDAVASLEALTRLAGHQPAAARLCLIESNVAGAPARERMEAAMNRAGEFFELALAERGAEERLPREAPGAILGGIREVIQKRLRAGREEELEELAPLLWDWALVYRAPPLRLPRPRSKVGSGGRYMRDDPAERIIAATVSVVIERGYQEMTITDIVARAGVSFSTFYEHFEGKRAALLAALDSGRSLMFGMLLPLYRRARDWPSAVRASFTAMFAFYAAEPDFTRMAMIEVVGAGDELLDRHEEMMAATYVALEPGFDLRPELPRFYAEAIGGLVFELAAGEVRRRGTERMNELGPLATYLVLSPFLGTKEAAGVARGRR
jgi:AcrR family transcriptional regulator